MGNVDSAASARGAAQDPPGTVGSFVWGVIGLTMIPLIASIIAIVMGRNARARAERQGAPDPSLARAGRILGWIGLLLAIVMLALFALVVVAGTFAFAA